MPAAETPPSRRVRDWAESGVAALTGRPDGPPLVPPGDAATVARDLAAHVAAAATLAGRTLDIDGAGVLSERAAFTGRSRRGDVTVGGSGRLLRTADGWAAVSCARPDDPALLGALISAEVDPADPWPAVTAWLASHSGAELADRAEMLGIAAAPVQPPTPPEPRPLAPPRSMDGLLVVDFGSLWAAPLCAHLLGLAGARVVKVETPSRPDGARRGSPDFYALLHGGHESVCLDPGAPADRRALAELVAAADVVVEASRPRALAGFGLDADAAAARGAAWLSITAAGRSSGRVGFGDDVAASAGLVATDADGPMFVGDAFADPLTGLTAAALACSADAQGRLIEVSMTDVVAATLTDTAAGTAPPGTGTVAARRDGGRWVVDAEDGVVEIALPRPRSAAGAAPELGRDTNAVLRSLGIATAGVSTL
ncbi:CoA transferase [Rhodococcus sp. Q]|uniref:CoA transferase n=1 Tax=Rhodococcus sp. Q TaxID=2502252 RepID=UPI0010F8BBF4|nr:CoA transferase [Rhodococcus sp. Q]